jgi:hypothetical protein
MTRTPVPAANPSGRNRAGLLDAEGIYLDTGEGNPVVVLDASRPHFVQ